METDRLPPHDENAEKGLLGCILLKPEIMADLRSQVIGEIFYEAKNRMIWETACDIVDGGSKLDTVTLSMRLTANHFMEAVGLDYLNHLEDFTPSAHNWPEYLDGLREVFVLRKIIIAAADCSGKSSNRLKPSREILDDFEREMAEIRNAISPGRDFADNVAIGKQLMAEYSEALDKKTKPGIVTGFHDIDAMMGGMKPQDLIVVAGSPSAGKTSLVLNVAQYAALELNVQVGIISLETSAKKLLHRNNCAIARVNGGRLMTGRAIEQDLTRLGASIGKISKSHKRIMIQDRGGLTAYEAASIFRRMHQKGARLFMLDYIQLLRIDTRSGNRNEEMAKISNCMKSIAKELDCPVIIISAINRESQKENRAPRLSDLRESGQLEFDADMALLLHPLDNGNDVRTVEVNLAKNKDGETGKTTLTFFPPEMRFESAAKIDPADYPHYANNDH